MKAIAIIGGFTEQDFDRSGSRDIYNKLQQYYGGYIFVEFAEWHEGKELAEYFNCKGVTEILVGAYSWGGGKGLPDLAKHADAKIKAVLCDPVYYSKFPWMRWRALTRLRFWHPTIRYPDKVEILKWYRQEMDVPRGSKIKAKKMPRKSIVLPYPHKQIDNSDPYKKAMLDAAKEFAQ